MGENLGKPGKDGTTPYLVVKLEGCTAQKQTH